MQQQFLQLFVALLVVGSANASAETQTLYKTVGPDGKTHYGDRPPADGRVQKTMQFENLPSSPVPDLSNTYVEQLRRMKASQAASAPPPTSGVVMYAASWCGYCRSARAYMAKKGIAYQEIDVDTEKGREAFVKTGEKKGGVPLLVSASKRVQGYSLDAYDAFFASLELPAKPASR